MLATDARGDAALAWTSVRQVGLVRTRVAVHVAFIGPGGRVAERTVWSNGDAIVGGVAVALDARGELTVAWIAAARARNGGTSGPHTIRAAYRNASGRWSAAQKVGSSGPLMSADLHLAVAPDREVLLTWVAHTARAPGVAAAWRRAGHGFGAEGAVSRAKGAMMILPTAVFDSGGAAHVYGTGGCGRRGCATMVSTKAHGHRFGAPLLIAPAPAEYPIVSFSAPGRALIAWEAGIFEDLEPSFAAPYARIMSAGALGPPIALQPGTALTASAVNAVAANGGGGTASWVAWPATSPPGPGAPFVMLAALGADGRFSQPSVAADGLVPALRDGAGDTLLRQIGPSAALEAGAPPSPIAMRPAAGGPPQPSPVQLPSGTPAPSAFLAGLATTEAAGAGAAVAWVAGTQLSVATWRP